MSHIKIMFRVAWVYFTHTEIDWDYTVDHYTNIEVLSGRQAGHDSILIVDRSMVSFVW